MADTKQFSRLTKITKGNTPSTDLKMTDIFAMQHIDLPSGANAYKQVSLAQSLCEPIAVTPNSTPSDGAYTATCSNYPDFSLTYTDASGNSHYLIGLKVRVVFTKGITYGSVSGGTYPTLNINGSGAIPLLAQGMTMAKGAAQNGQTIEFTIIPYGNGVAFDADSNVRESTSDYTIYTDGLQRVNSVANNNKGMVTSGGVADFFGLQYDDNSLQTITSQLTIESTLFQNIEVYVMRKNNLVYMFITGVYKGIATIETQYDVIANLPTKYRPVITQVCLGSSFIIKDSKPQIMVSRFTINKNGDIDISECGFATNSSIRASFIFMV